MDCVLGKRICSSSLRLWDGTVVSHVAFGADALFKEGSSIGNLGEEFIFSVSQTLRWQQ